ncbi:MAG: DUF368 domain-containing protein [Lachnospirales bacterium]
MKTIMTFINGFSMALADSVPGVSGGTVAFLMGFYDDLIKSLNNVILGNKEEKIKALHYLFKLGIGWLAGFIMAVIILSNLFETNIYKVSSLFIGFIIFAIPLIIYEEISCLRENTKMVIFTLLGITVVCLITYFNPVKYNNGVSLDNPNILMYIYVFVSGLVAVSAMILPGISGSTLLLIFGLYIPIINTVKDILNFNFNNIMIIIVFILGLITGMIFIIKLIKTALEKYRPLTIYLIIGLMLGSIYAIIMGPTTLNIPKPQLSYDTFSLMFFIIGGGVIMWLQVLKKMSEEK